MYENINSDLEALKLKEVEKNIYRNNSDSIIIPKIIPFKGVYSDMLYIRDNSLLFIKFMDTTEDVFMFLDEEILEILREEYSTLEKNMQEKFPNINFNYVFAFPYIDEIQDKYGMDEFIDNHIILASETKIVEKDISYLDTHLSNRNNEIELSIFLYSVCNEYYVLTDDIILNNKFKKLHFSSDDVDYNLCMMEEEQIIMSNSINYGIDMVEGGANTGKSSLLLSRIIKLSKIYPHHRFLLLCFNKQQENKYKELLEVLNYNYKNIEIFTLSSFVFRLAKVNNLVVNYDLLKKNYDKSFQNIIKQIQNTVENKRMYKGIFIDELENFTKLEYDFVSEFLYSSKGILNMSLCISNNINNNFNIYKENFKDISYDRRISLESNYLQSQNLVDFVNTFCNRSNSYIGSLNAGVSLPIYHRTIPKKHFNSEVSVVSVEDLDDQITAVIWELNNVINNLGYEYSDIAIVYPYNKKKLKNGKNIFFQYMLRKALENADIPYVYADQYMTSITKKDGVTISNIYSVKSLSYKVVILCELEMLYNQLLPKDFQEYNTNDFIGDLNKVYTAITRAERELRIIVSYTKDTSKIIDLIQEDINK